MNENREKEHKGELSDELLRKVVTDPQVRRTVTRQNHLLFFHIYFPDYVRYDTAPFQKDMFTLTEDINHKFVVVMAFRGSGKSTIMNFSYALWSVLGVQQKKCVLIVSKSQNQAKTHLLNIKHELEKNALLRSDLGPFKTDDGIWGSLSLELPRMNARIIAVSREQNIRGIRHSAARPDLIICDDLEDVQSVATEEERTTTHEWFMSEVIPGGDVGTRVLVLGNLLHEDSLAMRLKRKIAEKKLEGCFRAYPILDDNGKILWPGKFPSLKEIEALRKSINQESVWKAEYLLQLDSIPEAQEFFDSVFKQVSESDPKWFKRFLDKRMLWAETTKNEYSEFMRGFVISAPVIEDRSMIGKFLLEMGEG